MIKKYFCILVTVLVLISVLSGMFIIPAIAGTPNDTYKVERYYVEAHTSTAGNTTSETPVTAANLTFTPS
ncbi:hypothetical protein ACFLTT_02750, partial [Chloroflexota bacterium]